MSGVKLHLAIVPILAVLVAAVVLFPRATPRSAQVIPSGSLPGAETIPELSGAPLAPLATVQSPSQAPSVAGMDSGSTPGAAPRPSGGIGQPASYCKPKFCETPEPVAVDGIVGEATWWNSFGSGIYTALRPDLGSKGDLVIVCGGQPFHCVTAPVITSCACLGPHSDRLVDLSRDLFAEFADPSRGVVRITLQVVGR